MLLFIFLTLYIISLFNLCAYSMTPIKKGDYF